MTLAAKPAPTKRYSVPVAMLAAVSLLVGLLSVCTTASAGTGIVRGVLDAAGGVYWRSAPDWNTPVRVNRQGVYNGDQVELLCYMRGGTVPPYWNNPLWYRARIVSGFGLGEGLVNDHFINTGINVPNVVVPGVPDCNAVTVAVAHPKPASMTVNGVVVYSQGARHPWGKCSVEDFKDAAGGNWMIASYDGNGAHIARNGMLWGWFDQGGAPAKLGCPVNDEHAYMNGVRQDFTGGSLYWNSGMDHAEFIDPGREGAVNWAWSHKGQVFWPGLCLQFVVYSYINGQGWKLKGPYGDGVRAVDWWKSPQVPGTRHGANELRPPRGSLVFWSHWANGTGHAALSLGGGWVISTDFGGDRTVHIYKVADFQAYYQGWLAPA